MQMKTDNRRIDDMKSLPLAPIRRRSTDAKAEDQPIDNASIARFCEMAIHSLQQAHANQKTPS